MRHLCPRHKENTPSAVVYGERYHCFGCNHNGPISELGLLDLPKAEDKPKYVENIERTLDNIFTLPLVDIRGLRFHADSGGYYILWPDLSYYKYRYLSNEKNKSRYRSPIGVEKPLFKAQEKGQETLYLIEGEINALSVCEAVPELTVASPGGSGDFYSTLKERALPYYKQFNRVVIAVDCDSAGALAGIKLQQYLLLNRVTNVKIVLWKDKDANDVLVQDGKEAVEKIIQKHLEV